jgi:hypothetical protein
MGVEISHDYDPFEICRMDQYDYQSGYGKQAKKGLLTGASTRDPLKRTEAIIDGPVTAALLYGFWKLIYSLHRYEIGWFIKGLLAQTIEDGCYDEHVARFSAISYMLAVSKALHNYDRDGKKQLPRFLWNFLWKRESVGDAIYNTIKPAFSIIPNFTTGMLNVFLLNLNRFDDNFQPSLLDGFVEMYDLSTFKKLEEFTLPSNVEIIGGISLPRLLLYKSHKLERALELYSSLPFSDFVITNSIEHYIKKWKEDSNIKSFIRGINPL